MDENSEMEGREEYEDWNIVSFIFIPHSVSIFYREKNEVINSIRTKNFGSRKKYISLL